MGYDKVLKDISKSLCFVKHPIVHSVLIVALIVYCSGLVKPVNTAVSAVVRNDIVKLIIVIVIRFLADVDPALTILLSLALVLSLTGNENFTNKRRTKKN